MGVDLEPCVHAHGPDVELNMEASCYNNSPLAISSSRIHVWSFAIVVPTILFLFDPFIGQVKVLVFFRSFHLFNLYIDILSGIILWYLENITELHKFL